MVLFLSKLLPLLIYPIGLVSLLLLLALILVWRYPQLTAATILLALLVLVIPSSAWVSDWLVQSLEWRYLPVQDLPETDAIVVLGGAVRPQLPPRPWIDVMESGDRVLHGAQLYQAKKAPKLILSGGRIAWDGVDGSEAADMAVLAEALGVPEADILQEPDSLNTRQNAVNVQQLLEKEGMESILLVTTATHMPRALAVFQRLGIDAAAAPTDFLIAAAADSAPLSAEAKILKTLPDAQSLHNFTRAMKEYVGLIVYKLRGWA
ncbi:MAG: YdcF family protein [Elainellaceae cyanobacterium]